MITLNRTYDFVIKDRETMFVFIRGIQQAAYDARSSKGLPSPRPFPLRTANPTQLNQLRRVHSQHVPHENLVLLLQEQAIASAALRADDDQERRAEKGRDRHAPLGQPQRIVPYPCTAVIEVRGYN